MARELADALETGGTCRDHRPRVEAGSLTWEYAGPPSPPAPPEQDWSSWPVAEPDAQDLRYLRGLEG